MFFDDSRPDRRKRAMKRNGAAHGPRHFNPATMPPPKTYELFTLAEIYSAATLTLGYDVESYPNYFCVSFKCVETGKVIIFEDTPDERLDFKLLGYVMHRHKIVGFNSRPYDLPMVALAMQGARYWKLKQVSDDIIVGEMQPWEIERKYNAALPNVNHIDLIEVAPIEASLKIYAGRIHCPRMQDLPFGPNHHLTKEEAAYVRDYNINDLDNTILLYQELLPQIELREQLGIVYDADLRSKSDAQLAETVIVSELEKAGITAPKPTDRYGESFYYQVPSWLKFKTPLLQKVLEVVATTAFVIGAGGSAELPKAISDLHIPIGQSVYRMGIGGLHSSEKATAHYADANTVLIDRDVQSYYPRIILNQGLYPPQLGPGFLPVYESIVTRRLDAKARGDKIVAESLKIVINGSFGKFGNQFSKLYAPELLTQVTITGQLCLLLFIEMVELAGIPVVSANTDGIVIKCPKNRVADLNAVVAEWEAITSFVTEDTQYKALFSRDVNNYIAIKLKSVKNEDGSITWTDEIDTKPNSRYADERNGCKTKGVFSERGSALNSVLSKNPEYSICSDAVQQFLAHGRPIDQTIGTSRDIRQFVSVRTVRGGAVKEGVLLGKAIRWYYGAGVKGEINYAISGNAVPKSEGAKPCMDLPEQFPDDIDYDRYNNLANEILFAIGRYRKPAAPSLFV